MILHLSQLPARVFACVCCLTSLTPISRKFTFMEIWKKYFKWTFVPLCFRRVPSGQDRGFVQREVPCDQEAGVGTLLHCMAMLGHTVSHTHTHTHKQRESSSSTPDLLRHTPDKNWTHLYLLVDATMMVTATNTTLCWHQRRPFVLSC